MMPIAHIAINVPRSFGFTAFFSMIMEGRLSVVTAIIKLRIVPNCAPFASNAYATGIVPNMSAYIGIPTKVARITPNGLLVPNIVSIQFSGIQL